MNRRIAVLVAAAIVVSPITAFAQGGGGGSGGGSGGATGGASSGGATTGATGGATNNGMNSQQTTQSTSKTQTIQDQKNVVTSGSNTTPSQNGEGVVSGPGVGVGTSTNGRPIGSPAGLGSPENPVDARKLR